MGGDGAFSFPFGDSVVFYVFGYFRSVDKEGR